MGSLSYFSLSMLSSKVSSFVRSSGARLFSSSLKSISIKGFFAAKNYAIVGASTKPGTMGNIICENYKRVYKGETFYINPKGAVLISMSCLGGELFGQPIYKTPMDVPKSIEAAVVVISAKFAVSVAEECMKKGAKYIIMIPGGFNETKTEEGRQKQVESDCSAEE